MRNVEMHVTHEPPKAEGNPAVLIRTGGGNAPSLMGLRVLDRLNQIRFSQELPQVDGIFPIANERQVGMLKREASDSSRVLVDSTYAAIVDPYVSSHGRFSEHIDVVATQGDPTKDALMQRFGPLADSFTAMSVGLGESVEHSPRDIIGVLDAGSRYPGIDHPDHFFFFPVLASELWEDLRVEQEEYDTLVQVSDEQLAKAIAKMQEVEKGYRKTFLSKINSFSFRHIPEDAETMDAKYTALGAQPTEHLGRPVEYTPPMSPNTTSEYPTDDVEKPSIFVMFSGTGSAIEDTNAVIPQIIESGYDVLVPESAIKFGDLTEENQELVKIASSPSVILHPNVHGVVARPGFGTVWDDENAGIETMHPGHVIGDDHEMDVNGKTLDALGIGQVIQPGEEVTAENFRRNRVQSFYRTQELKERQIAEFRTKDGLGYVAEKIAEDLHAFEAEQSIVLDREILRTDAYEIKFISPEGFRMETEQTLSWYELAKSVSPTGELTDKQIAYMNRVLEREALRQGRWKYALRDLTQDGDTIRYKAGSEPYGGFETIGDPTDPEELLALASPHGNATVLITADNKIVVQNRKEWDEDTKTGNYFYGGIPGASIANLASVTEHIADDSGQSVGRPRSFGSAQIAEDVRNRAPQEIGVPAENITSIDVLGVGIDRVRVHTESLIRGRTDLTFEEIRNLPRSETNDMNGFAEEFLAIDATPDAIEALVTQVRVPLPPTHTAAFVAVGYSLEFDERIAEGLSREDATQKANVWMKRVQAGVQTNITEINKIVKAYWDGKDYGQMRPSGGKESRDTLRFDPGYSAQEQGLPSLTEELDRLQLVA